MQFLMISNFITVIRSQAKKLEKVEKKMKLDLNLIV